MTLYVNRELGFTSTSNRFKGKCNSPLSLSLLVCFIPGFPELTGYFVIVSLHMKCRLKKSKKVKRVLGNNTNEAHN